MSYDAIGNWSIPNGSHLLGKPNRLINFLCSEVAFMKLLPHWAEFSS